MERSLLRTDKELTELHERYVKMVYRICFAYMKNTADTEDMVQNTFVKLIKCTVKFKSVEHEKAWLIRTASNLCIDNLRHWWRKRESFENHENLHSEQSFEIDEVFHAVMELPDKYKTVVYMYYYEGYTSVEIANKLKKPKSTIRNYLYEARNIL